MTHFPAKADRLFPGDSEMAVRMRAVDWTSTPLGPVDAWPQCLRTAVSIVLESAIPMTVLWGEDLIQIYNDGHAVILGARHPHALGRPTREVWPEAWHINEPLYDRVRRGETVCVENQLYPITRAGTLEEAYFTLSYSPVRDETGKVGGVLVAATETAAFVLAARRLRVQQDLADRLARANTLSDVQRSVAATEGASDVPFAELHLSHDALPAELAEILRTRQRRRLDWPLSVDWPRSGPSRPALALPIVDLTSSDVLGVLVVGLPSSLTRDEGHDLFLDQYARQIRAALIRAHAERALRDNQERQAFVLKLSDALRAEADADAVANRALLMLFEQLQLDRCYIGVFRLEDDRGDFPYQVGNDRVPPLPAGVRLSDFPDALRVAFHRTLVIDDVERAEGLSDTDRRSFGALNLSALVAATVRKGEHNPLWSIVALCARPRRWTHGEIALIEEATERTWAAIERVQAEAALRDSEASLRASEARLQLALEATGLAAFEWDLASDRVTGNERFHELYGADSDEAIVGVRIVQENTHPADHALINERLGRAMNPASLGRYAFEYRLAEPDAGGERWILTHGQVHFEGTGADRRPVRVLGTGLEITERKRAEEALRTSEERYRTLFVSMDEAFAVVDVLTDEQGVANDFVFVEVNPAFVKQTGMEYPVGRRATELLGTPNPQWARVYGQVAATGEAVRFEEAEPTLGRIFDLYVFRLGGEGSRRVAVLFTNITEAKQIEEALREGEARFRAVANLVPDLLWESEPDGFTRWYNERWLEYTGQTFEQALGWGWTDAIHPEDRATSVRQYRAAVATVQPLRQEHRIRRHDGEYRWFVVSAFPLQDAGGHVVGTYGAATDIHDLRALNTALEERVEERTRRLADLNTELRALAGASSRDLNEPLRRLRGFLRLLERRVAEQLDAQTRRFFQLAQEEARRAERLAENFTALAQLEHRVLKWEQVALTPLLVQVRSDLAPAMRGKAVKWSVSDLPVVEGDDLLLRQAFTDLLHHALKLVSGGVEAQLEVGAEPVVKGVRVIVALTPAHVEEADLNEDGLATARRVVQRHGGTFNVERQGECALFVVHLPGRPPSA